MRVQQSEYGDEWYIMDRDEFISKIFYSEEKAKIYVFHWSSMIDERRRNGSNFIAN